MTWLPWMILVGNVVFPVKKSAKINNSLDNYIATVHSLEDWPSNSLTSLDPGCHAFSCSHNCLGSWA